ncbi:putative bifunctional diguanylate cyclase/phosphodiesterase [Aromatoleum toluclasticum]|uniref:putative bifunctional diguanylate cyclase/phosphodiesterase n=1 Tax=Aromatoleum toluclasticum TaxID=92003 RepID=UPI00037F2AD2|nr:GGDEF domain-containing phosphodiesterase [Aromatoleum toluclasticum]
MIGYSAADAAALRAFALAVPDDTLDAAFAACLERNNARPPTPSDTVLYARLLDRPLWGTSEWLDSLAATWLDCKQFGSPPTLPSAASARLVEAVHAVLHADDRSPGSAECDILLATAKLAQAVQAMLASASLERLDLRLAAGEGVDPLTGLPTRAQFVHALEREMNRPEQKLVGLVLLHLAWGAGGPQQLSAQRDQLRRQLSDAMGSALRPGDMLCSIADQEWALIMPELRSIGQVQLAARRLVEICEQLPEHSTPQLRGSIHAGTACAPEDGDTAHDLEHAARAALLRAMRAGIPVVCFHTDMIARMEHEIDLEHDIARTIAHPPFQLWLQPQIRLDSGRCAGAEALLRWQRTDGEWVSPPQIIDIATRLGLMPELSRWILGQAVRTLSELDAQGIEIPVSLNLVAADLHDEELPHLVAQMLATWRVPPARLVLEVTEGALISDRDRAGRVIQALRALGCGVSLDDFGTGFSSFAYMRDLPVSELKIDQLFVRDMLRSSRDHAIVATVQALAHGFGMRVVAEGVEDPSTADELRRMGCDLAQGFLYARAMPQSDFVPWVKARNAE